MDEKKRTAKGIKLNASQLPLSNKADFVIGADSRKVLDNKIIENLGGSGNHGYFPSTVGRDYKSWSVSRELEIPSLPDEADAQMRMIEGASAAEPLQSDVSGADSSQSDPFFTQDIEDETNPFAQELKHPDNLLGTDAEAPSPWSGPVDDAQAPAPPAVQQSVPENQNQEWADSPWAGPEMAPQTVADIAETTQTAEAVPTAEAAPSDQGQMYVETSEIVLANPNLQALAAHVPTAESEIIPSWMSAMATDATTGGEEVQALEQPVDQVSAPEGEVVELETFLNSIPDEEFIIDNETMRHLFSSLCEPKTSSPIKSPAREAADLAIAAAAAEILNTQVSIDEISLEDMATESELAAELQTNFNAADNATTSEADFEAIQKAYAMLDLSPLPVSKRKEGTFDNVFDVVEKAAEEQVLKGEKEGTGAQGQISRTERGTIEMAIHAGGRQLVPQYNFCGMLTGVEMSDGLSFRLSEEKNIWEMIEQSGKTMVSGIQSVSFDKRGNLSYVTKRGDIVTLKVDGTIDTKFAKKIQAELPGVPTSVSVSEAVEDVKATSAPEPVEDVKAAPVPEAPSKTTKKASATPTEKAPAKSPERTPAKPPAKPTVKAPTNVKQSKSKVDQKPQSKGAKPQQQQKVRQKQTKKGR